MRILEEYLSVLSYATSFSVRKSVLIIWRWDCYQLTDLTSNFFRNQPDQPIPPPLCDFHRKQGRRRLPTCSQNYTKEKKLPINPLDVHAQDTILLFLYYYVFLMSFLNYIFKCFISHVFEFNKAMSFKKMHFRTKRCTFLSNTTVAALFRVNY